MTRRFLATLLLGLAAVALPAAARDLKLEFKQVQDTKPQPLYEIHYRFTPVWSESEQVLRMEADFQAGVGPETEISLPTEFGAGRDFHQHIYKLRTLTRGTSLKDGKTPDKRLLVHQPNQRVTLAWDVRSRFEQPIRHEAFYAPIFRAEFFHFFGHAAFVYPEYLDKGLVTVNFEWRDLPDNWSLAGSYGVREPGRVTRWRAEGIPLGSARHALFVGGDFRVEKLLIRERPVYIALRGKWPFADTAFTAATQRLLDAHRTFWNDFDFPFYLITLIPNGIEQGSGGGTAVKHAFAMHVSNDFAVPGPTFEFLIGHEHLHTWVPERIGKMTLAETDNEALQYWFSEGFTNYLTHRLLVQSGFWTLERYATALNEVIAKHYTSPLATLDNQQLAKRFWESRATGELPYRRGELLAMIWNARLAARHGESLDALLRSLATREATELATTRVARTLGARIDGVPADIARYVDRGELPVLDAGVAGPCFSMREERIGAFDLGFDLDASEKDKFIRGVKPDSAAYAAGLRDGQPLRGFSFNTGDVKRDAEITILENKRPVVMRYRPVQPGGALLPQFSVKPDAQQDAACRAWFAL